MENVIDQVIEGDDEEVFRKWFRLMLKNNVVTIVFEKKNSEQRKMRATLDVSSFVPPQNYDESVTESDDKPNQVVWDLEASAWRSFRWDSLISYQLDRDRCPTVVELQKQFYSGM